MSINKEVIRSVMTEKYGKRVVNITPLDGYVDANFRVDIVDGISDENFGQETVIMKITSGNIETINLQNRIMTYLAENGVTTCTPVKTTFGDTTCKLNFCGSPNKGYIHGDFNDCNFIVSQTSTNFDKYTISGLIDYGDACVSLYIYEIATLMADMMSVCLGKQNPIDIGKLILRGYRKEFELKSAELANLKLVICVRMIQYYVLGAEILEKDPDNEYAGLDRDKYIKMCKYLWDMDDERFSLDFIEEKALID